MGNVQNINIHKNKIIEEEMWSTLKKKRMNIKLGTNEGLENILLEWFQQMRSENMPVRRTILHQKATNFALCLKINNFKI
jgi:hypothetical protein